MLHHVNRERLVKHIDCSVLYLFTNNKYWKIKYFTDMLYTLLSITYLLYLFSRFGVIHSVFTNLLLWTNGVLTESKHQLNEHKERLITLGFGNITLGKIFFLLSCFLII